MLTFQTLFPVMLDEDTGGGGGEAPDLGVDLGDIDLDAIAADAPAEETPDPEWAEPAEVPEGVDRFDRTYVEQLRQQAADYRTRARTAHEQLSELGDVEAAKQALAWRQELQTEAGVIKMFYDAGHALGLGDKEIEQLFGDGTTPDEDEDDSDLDLPVTMRELKEFLAKEVLAPQQQQLEAARQAEFAQQLKTRIDGVFDELGVTEQERGAVAALADQLIDPSKGDDAAAIEQAVRDATKQWNDAAAARVKAYVDGKRKVAASVPKTPDGGAPPAGEGETEPPPRSIAEAIERRRKRERAARGE